MLELIFILVFTATLLVTGITMVTVFAATGIALVVMFLLGMVGVVLEVITVVNCYCFRYLVF